MKATQIDWETDGYSVNLPTEVTIPNYITDKEDIADYLSDEYGYLVNGFYVEDDNELDVGDLVLWDDVAINDYPIEEREIQRHRVYQIIKIINDEIVLIADDYGEVEVLKTELRKID